MFYTCFKKGCEYEVQYMCLCLCCETYCCKLHLGSHLKLPYRIHSFDSILAKPHEWTKAAILEFLSKEQLIKEELKKIALNSCAQNSNRFIEESLKEIDCDLEIINNLTKMISQISEEGEKNANPWNLISITDNQRAGEILPEPYRSIMLFCISRQLRNKKRVILNRVNNDLETEQDFRRTCELYENLASDPLLSQVYHKLTSLYHFYHEDGITTLFIYNTEKERKKWKFCQDH